jgi:hypothetical protein
MSVVDRLLDEAKKENRWFKAIREAESVLRSCTNNDQVFAVMYIKGLLIRYKAGERSQGLLEELQRVKDK